MIRGFAAMTGRVDKPEFAQQGIVEIKDIGVKFKPNGAGPVVIGLLTDIKANRTKLNDGASCKSRG